MAVSAGTAGSGRARGAEQPETRGRPRKGRSGAGGCRCRPSTADGFRTATRIPGCCPAVASRGGRHELRRAYAGHLPTRLQCRSRRAGHHHGRAHRVRPGLHRRRRRRLERAERRRAGQVHPAVPGLRRRLRRHRQGRQPPDRVRRRRHQAAVGGLRGHLQELRRRVRAPCPEARTLPGVRRGLPALRAGVPRAPGRDAGLAPS